jgi:hypothetical protein
MPPRQAVMEWWWQVWKKALELLSANTPELMSGFIVVAVAGFVWWLRGYILKERIAALEERLRLGKEDQERLTNEIGSLRQKVSIQDEVIDLLRSTGGVPRTQVELLSDTSATIVSSLNRLEQANTNLGFTLTLTGIARQTL